jgi:hypothetical protein
LCAGSGGVRVQIFVVSIHNSGTACLMESQKSVIRDRKCVFIRWNIYVLADRNVKTFIRCSEKTLSVSPKLRFEIPIVAVPDVLVGCAIPIILDVIATVEDDR